jgi:hypothetical protein
VDEHLVGLLLQPQQSSEGANNDNDSTGAVQDEAGAGVSRQNSGEDDFGIALRCNACQAEVEGDTFTCGQCGEYVGS